MLQRNHRPMKVYGKIMSAEKMKGHFLVVNELFFVHFSNLGLGVESL